jgi:Domain of unknown function (DUF4082)
MILKKLMPIVLALLVLSHAAAAQSPLTIFGNATPRTPIDPDTNAVTLGVKFQSSQSGAISGIRFYRAARSSSGYVARLYKADGTMLASTSVSAEPCSTLPCWEELDFASPISIGPNTTYVAAYFVKGGHYAGDTNGLANRVTSGPLAAPASSQAGGNGVYKYGTSIAFPNQTYQASNYWVDVAFTPSAPSLLMSFNPPNPSIPSNAPPGAAVAVVNVTWSNGAPFTGNLKFAAPYGDDSGAFVLSGNDIIINPNGPGVGAAGGTTQNITINAVQ